MRLLMVMPTRSRPVQADEAAREAIRNADVRDLTRVFVAVDGDHEQTPEYDALPPRPGVTRVLGDSHRGMVGTLNFWAQWGASRGDRPFTYIGFMGDDHRPRTPRWDFRLMEAAGRGIAYGNDLNMGRKLPTAVVMHADIVRALGFMAPPVLGHLYVDNYWLELGRLLGELTYLDDVVIEHMHPTVGKGQDDEQYRRVNAPEQFKVDGDAWRQYRALGHLVEDVDRIRRYREGL